MLQEILDTRIMVKTDITMCLLYNLFIYLH